MCYSVARQRFLTPNSNRSHNPFWKTIILVLFSLSPAIFSQAHAASPVNALMTGLNFPVSLKFAPDGRIFYSEKDTGSIRIIQQNGTLLPTPFATISPIFTDGEAGLLGLALDPAFASKTTSTHTTRTGIVSPSPTATSFATLRAATPAPAPETSST
jgi:glucose/arabinose dehydrogenase